MRQRGRKSAAKVAALAVNGDPPRLTAPEHLNSDERALFTEIIEFCSPRRFAPSDQVLLTAYVQSILLSRTAAKRAADDPAALALWEKSTRMLATLATRLRLSPQARVDPKTVGRQQPQALRLPWQD